MNKHTKNSVLYKNTLHSENSPENSEEHCDINLNRDNEITLKLKNNVENLSDDAEQNFNDLSMTREFKYQTAKTSSDPFRQFDDKNVLIENLNVYRRGSGEMDISSSISKSSKAIDDIIDFKSSNLRRNSKGKIFQTSTVKKLERIKSNLEFDPKVLLPEFSLNKNVEDTEQYRIIKEFEKEHLLSAQLQNKIHVEDDFIIPINKGLNQKKISVIEEESAESVTNDGLSKPKKIEDVKKSRLFNLALKGEWGNVEQLLRSYNKEKLLKDYKDLETDDNLLMIASKENRLAIVDKLLELEVNVNEQAKDGLTALHYAAKFAKEDVVKLLISRKADPNIFGGSSKNLPIHLACSRTSCPPGLVTCLLKATNKARIQKDKEGSIPLMYAVEAGSILSIKELLEQETEIQIQMKQNLTGNCPIHIACQMQDLEALRLLVMAGSSVNVQNTSGQTPLHICASNNDEVILKYLYANKADANLLDEMDRSALHMAAEKGYTKIVEFLIDKFKCNVLTRDKEGNTLMHVTSLFGHSETTMAFLKRGVPLHMPNKAGSVCLHAAAQRGHISVVRALLDTGANVNVRTKDLYTPLHIAVKYCNPSIVETLIGYGADVDVKGGLLDESPLHIAAMIKGGDKCAEMLLKSGANVNEIMKKGETALHIAARTGNLEMLISLLNEGANPTLTCNEGNSPLHIAVRYCHYIIVQELINFVNRSKSRMDSTLLVNLPNNEGETALHFAAEIEKKRIHSDFEDTDIIKLLLEYDADMKIQTKFTGEIPLHYCAAAGNSDILLEIVNFLENKIQYVVNKQAKNGWSSLLFASEKGHHEIVSILLKNNARVDVFDEHGMTALHLAAEKGNIMVAEVLLSHKAFVNAKSKEGLTPLHLGAKNDFKDLIEILINKHNATIDALTLNKRTPLHLAAQYGKKSVCKTLLYHENNPANPNAADSKGQTPLHLAAKNDHADVVKLFLQFKPELLTKISLNGMTCAHIAAANGSLSVIKEFMKFNKSVIHGIKNKNTGSTPLHLAAEGGHYKVVKVILNAGANPYEENNVGMTCFHLAAKYGHIELLNCLKQKMDLKVVSNISGMTPLHIAAQYGQIDFVREILADVPANIKSQRPKSDDQMHNFFIDSGLTPLHLAAQSGHENVVRLLLNCNGVDVNSSTLNEETIPLHYAAQNGHTNVASLLLSKSASQISHRDLKGRTALHFSASHGHVEMAALFIAQGSEINAKDNMGFTPLHFAAKSGNLQVCKLLVESGAISDLETIDFKIPLIFAAHFNHTDVVSFLLRNDHSTEKLMDDHKFLYDLMICSKLNNFKSIEEFVLLSPAPAETAAKLSNEYRELSEREKERSKDLLHVGDYCEEMCTDLVALAAAEKGADKLLQSIDHRGMTFLDILIETEQKEVISHPSIQQYLSDVWMGKLNWPIWKFICLFIVFLFVPFSWLLAMFKIKKQLFNSPVIKFLLYVISHLYLTVLVLYISVMDNFPSDRKSCLPSWYEFLLLLCLCGLLVSELINPIDRKSLAILKYVILFFSTGSIIVQLLSCFIISPTLQELIYIRNQMLSVSTFFCFVVFLDFVSIHHLFGPWTIIIRDLIGDLFRFLVILVLFILGFSCMLTATVQPTQTPGPIDVIPTIFDMVIILYFTLFGLVGPQDLPNPGISPSYGTNLSQGVFGLALLILVIILVNLLIAMMADTYNRIEEECDTEWKFGRAKLIRNMRKTTSIPPPLILVAQFVEHIKIIYYRIRNIPIPDSSQENIIIRNQNLRRKSQIVPSIRGIIDLPKDGPENIEDVVKWPLVVRRYLTIRSEEGGSTKHDKFPEIPNE